MRLPFLALVLAIAPPLVHAQASALPSAQTARTGDTAARGRRLLAEMVAALGGDAWLSRSTWVEHGKSSNFYKGAPNPDVFGFTDYHRVQPYGERTVIDTESPRILLQMFGIPATKTLRDVAIISTANDAFLVDFKGKTQLPKDELADLLRRQKYTLEVIVKQWARDPGTILNDEGQVIVQRRIADRISLLTPDNHSAVLELDANTHLPITRTVEYRDPLYRDVDTDVEQYDDWHRFDGIMTPMIITRTHNGDVVSQRFVTTVDYNPPLSNDLFNPDLPIRKNGK